VVAITDEGDDLIMQEIQSNSVRFLKLQLKNYGIFLGSNKINFDRRRTLIVGMNGTGKTTIVNALANLGPATGVKPNHQAMHSEMSVEVVTEGNRNLITKYGSLIFLYSEFPELNMPDNENSLTYVFDQHQLKAIKNEAKGIFQSVLSRNSGKMEANKDLNHNTMAAGEKVCLSYAYAFAVRKILTLDLPVVFDSPYARLDKWLGQGVCAFLREQPYQQIILGHKAEFEEEEKPHYILEYADGYSRVVKNDE